MMNMTGIAAVSKRWRWCLVSLCSSGLLACGGSGSDPAPANANVLAATMSTGASTTVAAAPAPASSADVASAELAAAHGRATTYRVVKLGSGEITELPAINSSNQVVFSVNGPDGYRVGFFDGKTVRDIGTLGGVEAYARALNDAGQVAGYSSNSGGFYHAFRWSVTGGMVDLGTLYGAAASKALAINRQGQVVGYSDPSLAPVQAFIWSETAGMVDLGRLGTGSTAAQAVNDAGMAAGFSDAADGNTRAFAWTRTGGMVDLGTVGGIDSYATLISNAGLIAGYSAVDNADGFNYHGFVWSQATGMVDIGTLSGLGSAVLALNAAGQVAGVSDKDSLYQHAISWTREGGLVDLGTLGGTISRALGINKNGVVVGLSNTPAGQFDYRAFLWTKAQGMVDLNTRIRNAPPGLVLTGAIAISDAGAIVAESNAGLVLLKPGASGSDAPVVGPIMPSEPVPAGTRVAFSASFTDQNSADKHSAAWSWGDRCARNPGTVTESQGAGTARGHHVFCTAGVYPVTLTVTDSTGLSSTVARDVVVYDSSAAVVTGGGWFMSPQGAYGKDKVQAGRATFSFVSKVASDPAPRQGEMALKFHVGNLNFQSAAYASLSVAGTRAQYQGSGTVNGAGNYKFLMTVVDGGASKAVGQSRFRMKIWHIDARTKAEVVDYDNQVQVRALAAALGADSEGSALGGGSIVIRK